MSDEDMTEIDLGLGRGLQPGSLPPAPPSPVQSDSSSVFDKGVSEKQLSAAWSSSESLCSFPVVENDSPRSTAVASATNRKAVHNFSSMFRRLSGKWRSSHAQPDTESQMISDPTEFSSNIGLDNTNSDVALGTSLRQQRQLFEKELNQIQERKKAEARSRKASKSVSTNSMDGARSGVGDLLQRLETAQLEVELLRQDLEMCESLIRSKDKAIHILKQQCKLVGNSRRKSADDTQLANTQLIKELNAVNFELEHRQSSLVESQQAWAARFNSLCKEKQELESIVEQQADQLRQLFADKMLALRERDELSALLDVRDRSLVNKISSASRETNEANHVQEKQSSGTNRKDCEQRTCELTAIKLAILGACQCITHQSEPCQCALVATQLAQDVTRLTDELERTKSRESESNVACDAYRVAFEEQLNRNRKLLRKMVDIQMLLHDGASSLAKKKLHSSLSLKDKMNGMLQLKGKVPSNRAADQSRVLDEDLIVSLVDMVTDRSEALAHQRLATNLLAQRTQQLETQLSGIDRFHSRRRPVDFDHDDHSSQSPSDDVSDIFLDAYETV